MLPAPFLYCQILPVPLRYALKKMEKHKAEGLSGLVPVMINPQGYWNPSADRSLQWCPKGGMHLSSRNW